MNKHMPCKNKSTDENARPYWHKPANEYMDPYHPHDSYHPHDPCDDHDSHQPHDPCDDHDSCNAYECCDCCDIQPITSCLKKLKDVTNCVFECLEKTPNPHREIKVAFCILLTEISVINDKLDCISQNLCKLIDPCRNQIKEESRPASEPHLGDDKVLK